MDGLREFVKLGSGTALALTTIPAQMPARSPSSFGVWFCNPSDSGVTMVVSTEDSTDVEHVLGELFPGHAVRLRIDARIRLWAYAKSGSGTVSYREVF